MKNTLFLAVVLAGTVSVLGMQIQVYPNGNVHCEHCTTHQYDNTVTYNKHTVGPSGSTIYTEQRVVTTGTGASSPAAISTTTSVGSNNNQVIYEGTAQGCSRSPCGTGARCQETVGGRPVCSCPPGYQGNPLTYCHRSGCLDHSECGNTQVCRNGDCVNACTGQCGVNANCEVRNHVPTCSCPRGYRGDPFTSCRQMDPAELCHPSPCGTNTKCDVINNVPTCSCLSGYVGNPIQGCRHECESDSECGPSQHCSAFKCVNACDQCGKGADCKVTRSHRAVCECPAGYIGNAYSECRPECYGDRDCPSGRPACIYGICKNPCEGACGVGADCNLRGLTPICSCPKTHTGNPFVSCRPFTKDDLCNPNPCGTNAQCNPGYDNTHKERPVCTCLPGFVGNPLSHCQRGECQVNEDCPDHRACSNNQCINPCQNQCGVNAECESRRHVAVCKCPHGYSGDALVSCSRQSRSYPVARYY